MMFTVPTYVGEYRIGETPTYVAISLTKRPLLLHRKMMEWVFGWKWVDKEQS